MKFALFSYGFDLHCCSEVVLSWTSWPSSGTGRKRGPWGCSSFRTLSKLGLMLMVMDLKVSLEWYQFPYCLREGLNSVKGKILPGTKDCSDTLAQSCLKLYHWNDSIYHWNDQTCLLVHHEVQLSLNT